MRDFYNTNSDFHDYVNRYCHNYSEGKDITVEEALQHATVREVAEYRKEKEREENGIIESEIPKSGAD